MGIVQMLNTCSQYLLKFKHGKHTLKSEALYLSSLQPQHKTSMVER